MSIPNNTRVYRTNGNKSVHGTVVAQNVPGSDAVYNGYAVSGYQIALGGQTLYPDTDCVWVQFDNGSAAPVAPVLIPYEDLTVVG